MQYPVSMHLYCVSITYEAVEGYMKSPLEAFNVPAGQSVKWVNYLSPGKMVLPIADEKKISQIDLTRKVKMFWKFRSEILLFHTHIPPSPPKKRRKKRMKTGIILFSKWYCTPCVCIIRHTPAPQKKGCLAPRIFTFAPPRRFLPLTWHWASDTFPIITILTVSYVCSVCSVSSTCSVC